MRKTTSLERAQKGGHNEVCFWLTCTPEGGGIRGNRGEILGAPPQTQWIPYSRPLWCCSHKSSSAPNFHSIARPCSPTLPWYHENAFRNSNAPRAWREIYILKYFSQQGKPNLDQMPEPGVEERSPPLQEPSFATINTGPTISTHASVRRFSAHIRTNAADSGPLCVVPPSGRPGERPGGHRVPGCRGWQGARRGRRRAAHPCGR